MSTLPVFRLSMTSKPSVPATTPIFENCVGTFMVDSPTHHVTPAHHVTPTQHVIPAHHVISARHDSRVEPPSPTVAAVSQVEIIEPATSNRLGSITYDREYQRPTHEWNSMKEFQAWRVNEEVDHGIELLLSSNRRSAGPLWAENRTYSCSRQGSGGQKEYVRKREERSRKRPSKRTGCRCRVRIKTYHHVSTVLGWYRPEHGHPIGVANLMYTRLRDSTRSYVASLLRKNMSPKEVVSDTEFICHFLSDMYNSLRMCAVRTVRMNEDIILQCRIYIACGRS